MNKYLFLLLVVIFASCAVGTRFREGLEPKGVYGERRYYEIPHYNTGPFLNPVDSISNEDVYYHNSQVN